MANQQESFLEEEDWKSFIGENHTDYIPTWKQFKEEGFRLSFNKSALIFNVIWMLSRKMYLFALIGFLIWVVFGITTTVLFGKYLEGTAAVWVLFYLPFIFMGIMGDWLYYKHAIKKIAQINAEYDDRTRSKAEIAKVGGTTGVFIVLFTLAVVVGGLIAMFSFFQMVAGGGFH